MIKFDNLKKWLIDNSLWLAGLGLFVASSGIDGYYLVSLNAWGAVGGYALNTTSDIVGMLLMYWFGVFQQSDNEKKRMASWVLLGSELVTVAYSWLFSWRQYRTVIFEVETNPIGFNNEVEWLAFLFAGFIPLLLAFVGFAQGLQVSDGQKASDEIDYSQLGELQAQVETLRQEVEKSGWPVATRDTYRDALASMNGSRKQLAGKPAREVVEFVCEVGRLRVPDMSASSFTNWANEAIVKE